MNTMKFKNASGKQKNFGGRRVLPDQVVTQRVQQSVDETGRYTMSRNNVVNAMFKLGFIPCGMRQRG